MDLELRKIQLCQLDLALEVKRICEKNNINYFLIGGTLLGAIRHGGFIPWDDDLDIGMIRSDYEKFIEICKTQLDEKFFLQTAETDKEFGFGFAKIKIKGTKFVEEITKNNSSHKGIFIDIFPFDNMPEDYVKQKKQAKNLRIIKFLLLSKCNYSSWDKNNKTKNIIMKALNYLLKPINKGLLVSKIEKIEKKYNKYKTKNIINLEGSYNYKEFMPSNCVIKPNFTKFEGYEFKIPDRPEVYLENLYNDFMKLPPIEKRGNRHGIVCIDFGLYKIRNRNKEDIKNLSFEPSCIGEKINE